MDVAVQAHRGTETGQQPDNTQDVGYHRTLRHFVLSCSSFSWPTCKSQEFCHTHLHGRGCHEGQNSHPLCSGTFFLSQYDLNKAETKLCMLWVKLLSAQSFPLPWSSYKSFHILWLQSNENKTDEAQLIWLLSIMQWASEWL